MAHTMLRALGNVRKIDEENRTAEFVISTEARDRHGTVILADGWKFDNYNRNGVVAYQHDTSSGNPDTILGPGKVWQEGKKTIGQVKFEPADINPLAEKIFQKVKFGTLKASSVGFDPINGSYGKRDAEDEDSGTFYFREQDLLEWSIVNIPSNPEAVARAYGEQIEEYVGSYTTQESTAIEPEVVQELVEDSIEFLDEPKKTISPQRKDFLRLKYKV